MFRRKAGGASHHESQHEAIDSRRSPSSITSLLPGANRPYESARSAPTVSNPVAGERTADGYIEGEVNEPPMTPSPSKEKKSACALILRRHGRLLPQIGLLLGIAISFLTIAWMSGGSSSSSLRSRQIMALKPDPDDFATHADDDARKHPDNLDLKTWFGSLDASAGEESPQEKDKASTDTIPPASQSMPYVGREWTDEDQAYMDLLDSNRNTSLQILHPMDYIYQPTSWDGPPIVLEEAKLIFFTVPKVGCTVFKQLFRRIAGRGNWRKVGGKAMLPHNPNTNGLIYLHQYPLPQANEMMTSREWTRAIFVRHPIDRFISAYYDKGRRSRGKYVVGHCCYEFETKDKCEAAVSNGLSMKQFFTLTQELCERDPHWMLQADRMEPKYWKYVDFVGHIETAHYDAKQLLDKFGLWERFGKTGWGKNGTEELFQSTSGVRHRTAGNRTSNQIEDSRLRELLSQTYQSDFDMFYNEGHPGTEGSISSMIVEF